MGERLTSIPAVAATGQILKDGYWDRTEVIELPDGSRRVRKRTKGAAFGPWGVRSLRREIAFLSALPASSRADFPAVLTTWDLEHEGTPDVGYEMPFFASHVDGGKLARNETLAQSEVDAFQEALALAVLARLHEPVQATEPLSAHVADVVREALHGLETDTTLAPLVRAEQLELNGARVFGPRAAFERIAHGTDALDGLDREPCVRLHGDFFLENILWRPVTVRADDNAPQLLLVDPVSVAGVSCGPPVFDLVKYESYATGELPALRFEWVEVGGFDDAIPGAESDVRRYDYRICWEHAAMLPFRRRDWHSRFRCAFERRHGPVDRRLYRLIDGYFSAAMALNTGGVQRRARLLKATAEFNAVLAEPDARATL